MCLSSLSFLSLHIWSRNFSMSIHSKSSSLLLKIGYIGSPAAQSFLDMTGALRNPQRSGVGRKWERRKRTRRYRNGRQKSENALRRGFRLIHVSTNDLPLFLLWLSNIPLHICTTSSLFCPWSLDIYRDEPRVCYTEWSKSERERYCILMHICVIYKNGTDEPISKAGIEVET